MIFEKTLFLLVFIVLSNIGITQNGELFVNEEFIELKRDMPLFDHLGRIIGKLERVKYYDERGGIFKYTKKSQIYYKCR